MPNTAPHVNARLDALAKGLRWISLVLLLLIFATLWQSYAGRVTLVHTMRKRCAAGVAERLVARDESLSGYHANWTVANDPTQSRKTRAARHAQALAQLRAAEAREINLPRALRKTKVGKRAPEFSCERAYPPASIAPWE